MDLSLTEDEIAVILSALKRYLVEIRHDYDEAVEIGDPMASRMRERRDIILDLIETIDPEGPKP